MGMHALGAYLRVLREAHSLSRSAVEREVNIDDTQIDRIEKGVSIPRGPFLFALIGVVHGNLQQASQLFLDPDATVITGEQLARSWLAQQEAEAALPERVRYARQLFAEIIRTPHTFERLIGYAEGLLSEAPATVPDEGRSTR